ncbi:alpha/beta hydrolase family protein [Flavobacterium sp.]|uniref:alpha/beta hydrolase family protein n=1 Tax=Flavobacterium sp. TaxID=239 RepID=UPI002FDA7671
MNYFPFQKTVVFFDLRLTTITLLFILLGLKMHGQELSKQQIKESDFQKWGKLINQAISEKGNWISYSMQYSEAPDTLFVESVNKKKNYQFANANKGEFIGEMSFIYLDKNKTLNWMDLNSGKVKTFKNIKSYEVANGHYIITIEQRDNKNYLGIRDYKANSLESIEGVVEYKLNNSKDALLCYKEENQLKSITIIKLGAPIQKTQIWEESQVHFSNMVWSESNQSIAFLAEYKEDESNRKLYHYSLLQNNWFELNPKQIINFPKEYQLSSRHNNITISPDDKRVILGIVKNLTSQGKRNTVQIWKSSDAVIHSEKKYLGELDNSFHLAVWWPQTGKFSQITEENKQYGMLNNNKDYALIYNYTDYPHQYTMNRNVNYYVKNLETGEQDTVIHNQLTVLRNSSMSPRGKYFAYFNNKGWWVYDFVKKENIALLPTVDFSKHEYANEKSNFGVAGWCQKEENIILYDQYDVWKVPLNGESPVRITRGREKKIAYRVVHENKKKYFLAAGNNDPIINFNKEILLSATTDNETGYFVHKPNGKLVEISFDKSLHSNCLKASKANKIIFLKQNYDTPPRLMLANTNANQSSVIYQSNSHHFDYQWHKQEIITFKNSHNQELKGMLYYPNNYNPLQQYPMVVYIYEEQSLQKNKYTNPSKYNMTGFNLATFTSQGYFVLMPDITYQTGNPGLSALDCVVAATTKVINSGKVQKNKIALMGQSFGGYETNFIISQTNLFKTAISGVSIFDTNRMYFTLSESSGRPEMWRFESQQWRMGKMLFEDRKAYSNNSPVNFVENITTPLLIWCGEEDKQVNPDQSIALYLALKRLKKEGILLMYPNESHSINSSSNQVDLYSRIKDWLAYHLKEEPPADWIKQKK